MGLRAGWRQYFVTTHDHAHGGTTTRARLTLLDAWPDANETSHGRSLPLGKVLAGRSSVSQPFFIAVPQPFLRRSWAENGGKLDFWAAVRPFLAPHDLKSVPPRQKRAEDLFKSSVLWFESDRRRSSAITISLRSWCQNLSPRLGANFSSRQ